jgi:hypothetical protein
MNKIKRLQAAGIDTTELENDLAVNKIVMVSSAFYKFNHMYKRIENYNRLSEKGEKGYAVRSVNYLDMPEGFMNEDIINEAKETMPAVLFNMEYLSRWESDSDGVFKASLLENCKLPAGDTVRLVGDPDKDYVIACDPARTSDDFSIVVIEIGEKNKVVNAFRFNKMKFPQMSDTIVTICDKYNTIRVVMDSQGGGHAIKDLLSDTTRYGNRAIIDIEDEEYLGVDGRRILQMVNPSPIYNVEANYATLSLLEHGKLFFAGPTLSGIEEEEDAYDNIQKLIIQMMTIVSTQTKSGTIHFDVPTGGGHGVQKKDLYSALIYRAYKVYQLDREKESTSNIIWGSGLIIPQTSEYKPSPVETRVSPYAILTKVKK